MLKQRILDRLQNPDKFKPINQKEIVMPNKSEQITKRFNKVKSENNIVVSKFEEVISSKRGLKSMTKRTKEKIIHLKKG